MELKIMPWDDGGEILYHVVDAKGNGAERPVVIFTGSSWAEAEQYIADLGGG
jgi:hypothetical protein